MFNRAKNDNRYGAWICEIKTKSEDDFIQNQINELLTNYNQMMIELNSNKDADVTKISSKLLISAFTNQIEKIAVASPFTPDFLRSVDSFGGEFFGYIQWLSDIEYICKRSAEDEYYYPLILQSDAYLGRFITDSFHDHVGKECGFEVRFAYTREQLRNNYVSVNGSKLQIPTIAINSEEKKAPGLGRNQ